MSTTTLAGPSQGEGQREYGHFSILHIILIAFGGVVFIIGIVVVIVLLKSRKKFCGVGRESASQGPNAGQPPIFVIGQDNGQLRGGDNPAFCRSEETSSAAPLRGQVPNVAPITTRLPTYEEVMTGRVPSGPVARSNIRVSQLPYHRGASTTSSSTAITTNVTTTTTAITTATAATAASGTTAPNAAYSLTTPRSSSSGTPPPRYAYEYPSCFWEEVPPPPYPSGNYGIVRAMGGGGRGGGGGGGLTGCTGSVAEDRQPWSSSPVIPATLLPGHYSPNPGRAPLAVPTPTVLSPAPSPAVPPRNHTLTSGPGGAVPLGGVPPTPLLPTLSGREVTRPLASSSPAVPRRQPPPVSVPVHGLTAGGGQNSPHNAVSRPRSGAVRGQGQESSSDPAQPRHVASTGAPLARFDIEL